MAEEEKGYRFAHLVSTTRWLKVHTRMMALKIHKGIFNIFIKEISKILFFDQQYKPYEMGGKFQIFQLKKS